MCSEIIKKTFNKFDWKIERYHLRTLWISERCCARKIKLSSAVASFFTSFQYETAFSVLKPFKQKLSNKMRQKIRFWLISIASKEMLIAGKGILSFHSLPEEKIPTVSFNTHMNVTHFHRWPTALCGTQYLFCLRSGQ